MPELPHIARPCRDCPFRNDTLKEWLGAERMQEILGADSFVCHKKTDKQCAGHMLIKGNDNLFVRVAGRMGSRWNYPGASWSLITSRTVLSITDAGRINRPQVMILFVY
jgi:hypothetical protein